eukprot:scaffold17458_cov140-Isochrysis_galbana.AAC.3
MGVTEWFEPLMKPFVHYVPVSSKLLNLSSAVRAPPASRVHACTHARPLAPRAITHARTLRVRPQPPPPGLISGALAPEQRRAGAGDSQCSVQAGLGDHDGRGHVHLHGRADHGLRASLPGLCRRAGAARAPAARPAGQGDWQARRVCAGRGQNRRHPGGPAGAASRVVLGAVGGARSSARAESRGGRVDKAQGLFERYDAERRVLSHPRFFISILSLGMAKDRPITDTDTDVQRDGRPLSLPGDSHGAACLAESTARAQAAQVVMVMMMSTASGKKCGLDVEAGVTKAVHPLSICFAILATRRWVPSS